MAPRSIDWFRCVGSIEFGNYRFQEATAVVASMFGIRFDLTRQIYHSFRFRRSGRPNDRLILTRRLWRWPGWWLAVGRTARQRFVDDRLGLLDDNTAARRVGDQHTARPGFVGRHESGQLKVVEHCAGPTKSSCMSYCLGLMMMGTHLSGGYPSRTTGAQSHRRCAVASSRSAPAAASPCS